MPGRQPGASPGPDTSEPTLATAGHEHPLERHSHTAGRQPFRKAMQASVL